MARIRYRYLLPLGHLLVDVIVLSHIMWHTHQALRFERGPCGPRYVITQTLPYLLEPEVEWSFVAWWTETSLDYRSLALGTLPAGLISFAVRPEAEVPYCDRLLDPVWFSIHESIALFFWFLVGWKLDSSAARLRKLLVAYLGLRFAFALLGWLTPVAAQIGLVIELLFWLGLTVLALVYGCLRLLRRLRTRT
ncbi:MAG: hypothetical protein ACLQGV_02050 [Bryobacteraceae bacterium]